MAFIDYANETDEERRRRLEQEAAAAAMNNEPVGSGGSYPQNRGFGDMMGAYVDKRLGSLQDRIDQAGQYLTDPEAAIQRRIGMQAEAANTEVETQTVKTYGDGSQERIVKTQMPAAQPEMPVAAPVAPVAQAPAPVAQAPAPVAPGQEQRPQLFPAFAAAVQRQAQPLAPIPPEAANQQIQMPQLPQPGPPVQTASIDPAAGLQAAAAARAQQQTQQTAAQAPAPTPSLQQQAATAFAPTVERELQQPMTRADQDQMAVVAAHNEKDPGKRRDAFAQLIANPDVSEPNKALANKFMAESFLHQKNIEKATREIEEKSPSELSRYLKETKKEGSYIKAILLARLGLTDLAAKEQELINPTRTADTAVVGDQKYTVFKNKNGTIDQAFDINGKKANQDEIAKIMAAAMPTKSFLLPQSGGGLMQKTITGPDGQPQVITGQVFTDPLTKETYFQAGKNRYDTSGLSTPAQNVQNVFGAAQAGGAGKVAGETGMAATPLQAFPGQAGGPGAPVNTPATPAAPVDPAAVSRAQRNLQSLQSEITKIPAKDPKRDERLNILNSEIAKNQSVLQQAGQTPMAITQPFWKQKQSAELSTEQAKANIQAAKEVNVAEAKVPAEARGKVEAKEIASQDFADKTYKIIRPISDAIKQSTGSGLGAVTDDVLSIIGKGTTGSANIAKLNALSYQIISQIPRMEGAQSNIDVEMYKQAAGDLANRKAPVADRLAALQTIITMMEINDREKKNDWGAFSAGPQPTGQSSTGVKWKVK